MKINSILIFILILVIHSCSNRHQDVISHQKYDRISGTYTGLIPCENCPGIWFTLKLNENRTYTTYAAYQHLPDIPFVDSGRYTFFDINKISLQKEKMGHAFFLFEKNMLEVLDAAGNRVVSDAQDLYKLKKIDPEKVIDLNELEGKWILKEVFNNEIHRDNIAKLPFLEFRTDGNVNGNAGCNSISSTFVTEGDILLFNPFITTKMDCGDPIESVILEGLMGPLRVHIENGRMVLQKNNDELLKFKKAD